MIQQFDVLVIGGGIVGLTAALAMAQKQHSVAIIDSNNLKVDTSKTDLRVYAINHASQQLLTELGAWSHIDSSRISPYSHMHVWDAANGACIDFDSRIIAASSLGSIIEESVLKQALLKHILSLKQISLFPNSTIEEVSSDQHGIQISSQEKTWAGQLLMIADGANSPTRNKLKVELTSWSYKQHALVASVTTEKPHQKTAYQVFNKDGPLAFLPLADPHQCSIVWSSDPGKIQQLIELDDDEFKQQLTQSFAEKLGQIQATSMRHQFPLQMRHVKQYAGNRWLLLGDAAHTIHPLAGLGLNVGLADVRAWMNCLERSKGVYCSTKLLGSYQRERKHAVWQVILQMEGFKRLFSPDFSAIGGLRGFGLRACNKLTPLKRYLIQHATGIPS